MRWDRMQFTSVCLTLVCLRVSPDRSQFSKYDAISLSCEDQFNSTGWRVKRNTTGGWVSACTLGWGSSLSASTCRIGNIYPSDSGTYWCESDTGERSNAVNITITDHAVILISPAHPVPEGAAVTLGCKAATNSSIQRFEFYKDGSSIGSSSTGRFTVNGVSKSDEGLYKCSVSGGGESVSSWLAIQASATASPAASCRESLPRLICHVMAGAPYLLSTILLGLIYRDRRAAQRAAESRGSRDVIMEVAV